LRCSRVLAVCLVALPACRREAVPHAGPSGGKAASVVAGAPGSGLASAQGAASDAGSSAPTGVASADSRPVITRRDGAVSVEPQPACAPAGRAGDGGKDPAATPTEKWLSDPEIQAKRPGEAIERELVNWKPFVAGTYLDNRRRAMGIVMHQDFADYDGIRQKLEALNGPLKIVLRPACHPRQTIDEARRVLDLKDWHPRAKAIPMLWHFDAGISAFSVTVDDSAPEVAQALEQRLGDLVRTRLVKLEPR